MIKALKPLALAIAAVALVSSSLVGAATSPAAAQAGGALTGEWKGGYVSGDGSDVNTFDVKLVQAGSTLSGTVIEVNTFGDTARALFLTSTLSGQIRGRTVTFTKTYDGSGGVAHSLSYTGELEPNGRRIRGTYNAEGATGVFEMVR